MSFRTIDELVSVLQDPFAKTNPEIRGGVRDRTILTREHDENGVFFVRKINEGRLSILSKYELRLMEDIAERAPDDPYVDEYLAKLLQMKKDYNHHGSRSEIVMQWHGFDLGDFMRLLPPNYNDNWRNSTFLLQLLKHALRALYALHNMEIIHSDIKRDNITLEFNPAEDFLKSTREIVLRPKNITLIDFGISLSSTGDFSHLKRIGFASYAEGGELYSWKAERLREAHEELNRGKDDLIRKIDYRVDLFGLSYIFKDFIKRGLLEPEDHPHRVCLQQVIAELEEIEVRGNASHGGSRQREALYARWRELIERAFKEERPTTLEWVFKMPADKILYQEEDRKAPEAHLSYVHSAETLTQSPSHSQKPSLEQAQPDPQPESQAQPQQSPPQLLPVRRVRKGLIGIVLALLIGGTAIAVLTKGHGKPENAGITAEKDQGGAQSYGNNSSGTPAEIAAAAEVLKAAEQGDAEAQNKLGVMYEKGQGVILNYEDAVKWYLKAAEQGHAAAQYNLGVRYELGISGARDYGEAAKWYRKAAEQGHAEAQHDLGTLYMEGAGVAQDRTQAYLWIILSIARLDPASEYYSDAVAKRDNLATRLTAQQLAEAQRLAEEWEKLHQDVTVTSPAATSPTATSSAPAKEALIKAGEDIATICARIKKYDYTGTQHYRQKAYAQARGAFISQAKLTDVCESTSEHQRAIAYNNIALTYFHQQQYAWAFAWANLVPADQNSRHNLEQIRPYLAELPVKIAGTYVQYAGQGAWSVITVQEKEATYEIDGKLLYMGENGLLTGPNLGDFSVSMPQAERTALYRPENGKGCEISVRFGENRLALKTTGDGQNCGFSLNVHAEGEFLRVE